MNTKLIVAALLAGVAYFFLGWGTYSATESLLTMPEGLKETIEYSETEFKMPLMVLSCMVWGLLIAYLLMKMGIANWKDGAITSAIVGAIISLAIGSSQAAMYKFGSMNNTMIDMLANGVSTAVAGALAGWWLGRK
jgi:hypothetical protein